MFNTFNTHDHLTMIKNNYIEEFVSLHQILYPNDKFNLIKTTDNTAHYNYIIKHNEQNEIKIEINYTHNADLKKMELILLNTTNISSDQTQIIYDHLNRLIKNKKLNSIELNAFTEFLFQLSELIGKGLNYFNYCTICGNDLELKGLTKISCCHNPQCVSESYLFVLDNKITDTYKQDPVVFSFLLEILIIGTLHSKGELAFKPIPIIPDISNLNELKNLIAAQSNIIEKNKLIKLVEHSSNDLELMEKTNPQIYALLKNAVSNNYFSMCSRDNIQIKYSNNISTNTTNNKTNSLKFIHINYSTEIENKFTQKYFLFHGSSLTSWYPIVKNGLKVMSGTAMMANGAAYGNGIYFSDSFQMSWGYATRLSTTIHGYGTLNVVGVFEILEDPARWKKSQGIYVIEDEKVLLLRTLVLLNSNSVVPKDLSNYFLKEIPLQKQTNKLNVGILKNKRLEGEHKKLSGLNFIDSMDIQNQHNWVIILKKIKSHNIKLNIIFSNYPINPPVIKLSNTNIKINNFIGLDKTIKIDLINPANWKITNNLAEIITIIYKCFQESL